MLQEKDWIEIAKLVATVAGGIFIFFKGRQEYRKSTGVKRAEFLDKLIAEFLQKNTEIARNMLDDYVYVNDETRHLTPVEQKANATPLKEYLRKHDERAITSIDEIRIRRSFDSLFDFFTKLSYYLSNKLITPTELCYFRYYIVKLKKEKKDDVNDYIDRYFYKSDFDVLYEALDKLEKAERCKKVKKIKKRAVTSALPL